MIVKNTQQKEIGAVVRTYDRRNRPNQNGIRKGSFYAYDIKGLENSSPFLLGVNRNKLLY